jgi:Outer membrane protein beta-barrel domain
MRRCLPHLVLAACMCVSLPALADKQNCPPGSWFCAEADTQPQAEQPPAAAHQANPEDEPDAPPAPTTRTRRQAPPGYAPPPVVVYDQQPPPHVVIVSPGYRPAHRALPPPPAHPAWHPEWAINLRVEGIGFAHEGASNAGMGGIGASLRYRPVPHFALEAGFDLLAGNDFNGFERTEVPFSLNGILYLNPQNRVQVYLLGGMHLSRAEVQSDMPSPLLHRENGTYGATYTYFGGQGGGGLEFRLSRRIGLDLDVLGFIRKRTDDGNMPEYVDWKHGRATNTSAGAMFRGGLSFWW